MSQFISFIILSYFPVKIKLHKKNDKFESMPFFLYFIIKFLFFQHCRLNELPKQRMRIERAGF